MDFLLRQGEFADESRLRYRWPKRPAIHDQRGEVGDPEPEADSGPLGGTVPATDGALRVYQEWPSGGVPCQRVLRGAFSVQHQPALAPEAIDSEPPLLLELGVGRAWLAAAA